MAKSNKHARQHIQRREPRPPERGQLRSPRRFGEELLALRVSYSPAANAHPHTGANRDVNPHANVDTHAHAHANPGADANAHALPDRGAIGQLDRSHQLSNKRRQRRGASNGWHRFLRATGFRQKGLLEVHRGYRYATDGGSAYIYAFRGGRRKDFWRFNVSSGLWEVNASVPTDAGWGSSLAWDGSDTIYAFTGDGGPATNMQAFWKYSIAGDSWTGLADTPLTVGAGGALAYLNGKVYALRGGGQTTFWRYNVGFDTWTALETTPATVDQGGALATDGVAVYALRGDISTTFWRYSVTGNTWTVLASTPANVSAGGALDYLDGAFYALGGNNTTNFWIYDD